MDRKRIEGGLKKTTDAAKEKTRGSLLGIKNKAEKTESRIRSDAGDALDAVREVVNNEK